jgi:hypothetical protein
MLKTQKKTLFAFLAVSAIPPTAFAQGPAPTVVTAPAGPQMLLGGDAELALPVGDFSKGAGIGIGALLRYEYFVNPKINVTGRTGYIYHLSKDNPLGIKVNFHTIPILGGIKYAVTDQIYGAAEAGLFLNGVSGGGFSSSSTDFGITLGGGFRTGDLDIRAGLHILDLGNASKSMALVVNAGYNFWKK